MAFNTYEKTLLEPTPTAESYFGTDRFQAIQPALMRGLKNGLFLKVWKEGIHKVGAKYFEVGSDINTHTDFRQLPLNRKAISHHRDALTSEQKALLALMYSFYNAEGAEAFFRLLGISSSANAIATLDSQGLEIYTALNQNYVTDMNPEETDLIKAAKNGDFETVKILLEQGAELEAKDCHGSSAFLQAIKYRHLDIAQYLAVHGANVNTQDHLGYTAAFYAASNGHLEALIFLAAKGAKLDSEAYNGYTAEAIASEHGYSEILEFLTAHKNQIEKNYE